MIIRHHLTDLAFSLFKFKINPKTYILKELIGMIGELGTTLAVTSNLSTLRPSVARYC
jgi:hypothetical protein